MKTEFKKYISVLLLRWSFAIMPDCEFKSKLAKLISKELLFGIDKDAKQINDVMKTTQFRRDLYDAIESGVGEEWAYNGEDESKVNTFNATTSFLNVYKVLVKYLK